MRPRFHFTPMNWMNDPIPFCRDGVFHVFYQHNPAAPVWGDMHWGHATSTDLVTWTLQPVAIAPSESYDKDGIFTGSIVESEGKFYAFYTGIPKLEGLVQEQCLAVGSDLYHWEKVKENPLITEVPKGYGGTFRDPQILKVHDEWWMLVGSNTPKGGAALLYTSHDLLQWTYQGPLHEAEDHSFGEDYECPDFFPFGDKWVLLSSRGHVHWQIGTLEGYRFTSEKRGLVDANECYYAAKSTLSTDGSRILFAWLRDPVGEGWAGALALPRELFLADDGSLGQRPARELKAFGVQEGESIFFEDEGIEELFPKAGPPASSWKPRS